MFCHAPCLVGCCFLLYVFQWDCCKMSSSAYGKSLVNFMLKSEPGNDALMILAICTLHIWQVTHETELILWHGPGGAVIYDQYACSNIVWQQKLLWCNIGDFTHKWWHRILLSIIVCMNGPTLQVSYCNLQILKNPFQLHTVSSPYFRSITLLQYSIWHNASKLKFSICLGYTYMH